MTGIYYLSDGLDVLYVGQSRDVASRVSNHRSKGLDFAGYFVDQCPESELDAREVAAITEFKPRLNEQLRG